MEEEEEVGIVHHNGKCMKGELQYISDTMLIDKIVRISYGLSLANMEKRAGIVDSINLQSGAAAIKDAASKLVDEHGGSDLGAFGEVLFTGWLFKNWPFFAIFNGVARIFHLDLLSMVKKIWNAVKHHAETGDLTHQHINDAAKQVAASESSTEAPEDELNESDDMFYPLRTASISNLIIKNAYNGRGDTNSIGGMWRMLKAMFSGVGSIQRINIFARLAGWLVTSASIGFGILALSGAARRKLFGEEPKQLPQQTSTNVGGYVGTTTEEKLPSSYTSTPANDLLTRNPQSYQFQQHKNNETSLWEVPLVNQNIEDTLKSWLVYTYPKLKGKEYLVNQSNEFHKTVGEIKAELGGATPGTHMFVPGKFHSIPQIVDQFAADVAKKVKQ